MPYYNYKKARYIDNSSMPFAGVTVHEALGAVIIIAVIVMILWVQIALLYTTAIVLAHMIIEVSLYITKRRRNSEYNSNKQDAEWNEMMAFINRAKARNEGV